MNFKIDIYDSKYTLVYENNKFHALRYGKEWRDLTGDGMVLALCNEILELKEEIRDLEEALEESDKIINSGG